jgi:hypothetical protein
LTPPDQAISAPAWSPDGQHIAYTAMPAAEGLAGGEPARQALLGRHLWVINVEDGQSQSLTDDPAYRDEHPLWSSDGRHILFARLDDQNRASVWLISADDGEPQQVVSELTPAPEWFGYYGHLNWDDLLDWWPNTRHVARVPAPTPPGSPSEPSPSTPQIVETSATPVASTSAASTQTHNGFPQLYPARYPCPLLFAPTMPSWSSSATRATATLAGGWNAGTKPRIGSARRWTSWKGRHRPPGTALSCATETLSGSSFPTRTGSSSAGLLTRASVGRKRFLRETGVVLVREEYAPDGTLEQAVRTLEVQFNVDLPAHLFTFEPPAGVTVEDQR